MNIVATATMVIELTFMINSLVKMSDRLRGVVEVELQGIMSSSFSPMMSPFIAPLFKRTNTPRPVSLSKPIQALNPGTAPLLEILIPPVQGSMSSVHARPVHLPQSCTDPQGLAPQRPRHSIVVCNAASTSLLLCKIPVAFLSQISMSLGVDQS